MRSAPAGVTRPLSPAVGEDIDVRTPTATLSASVRWQTCAETLASARLNAVISAARLMSLPREGAWRCAKTVNLSAYFREQIAPVYPGYTLVSVTVQEFNQAFDNIVLLFGRAMCIFSYLSSSFAPSIPFIILMTVPFISRCQEVS